MSEYLSKEEIKQWRSSLEKITLEEFAARLGKKLEEEKHTNDLVDILMKNKSSFTTSTRSTAVEKISNIAERALERERTIAAVPFTPSRPKIKEVQEPVATNIEKIKATVDSKPVVVKETIAAQIEADNSLKEEVHVVFKKALTDREQLVFDYFVQNRNKIIYAKDLASLLNLPRDYVYKYIKNLRAKIDGEKLKNVDSGGFSLTV